MAISTNQFKNGNHIDVEGTVFKILEFQHVKPGKGGAFVRTKLRRASDGAVIDRTFRAGEKFRAVRTETRRMQFLYADGDDAHFMDTESFEQIAVAQSTLEAALRWIKPSSEVDMLFIDDQPADVQLPGAVDLEVTETDPGVRGDTASGGGSKPATLETGATIMVPLFVDTGGANQGETSACVTASPRSGECVSRRPVRPAEPSASMRRSDQRRAAAVALYQHDLTSRPLEQTLGDGASALTRALAQAAADRAPELDELLDRHAHGWSVQRMQPLERSILRVALVEMLHPDEVPGARADPAGRRDRGGGREREDLLRRRCARVRERRARGGPARSARECAEEGRTSVAGRRRRPMNDGRETP